MTQYISKSAVVAEIERLHKEWRWHSSTEAKYRCEVYRELSEFLDTLKVKEVDEEYNGKAMLHILTKGVEQGKREILDKACEWLRKGGSGWYLTTEFGENEIDFVKLAEDFRKAMEG